MSNAFANLILLLWIPICIVIGSITTRERTFLLGYLGGTLFLPERLMFDLPVLPSLDKHMAAVLGAWIGTMMKPSAPTPPSVTTRSLMLLALLSVASCTTALLNGDPVPYGSGAVGPLTFYDGFSASLTYAVAIVLPYHLGQTMFGTVAELRRLLIAFAASALIYTPLVIWESQMSPLLHINLYGYFQHSWEQMVRGDGFRAIVFLAHGLTVAFFISQAVLSCVGLMRAKADTPMAAFWVLLALIAALISSKSMAATMYVLIGAPLIWFSTAKRQISAAAAMAALVVVFPILRVTNAIPLLGIIRYAAKISGDRAQSLAFRFYNEDVLLEHARDRFVFGWGGNARSRVFDEQGNDVVVTDGEWIMRLGFGGLVHYLTVFLLLLWPVFLARRNQARFASADQYVISTTALMLAFTGLDLIPNSLAHTIPFLLAGALMATCRSAAALPAGDAAAIARGTGSHVQRTAGSIQ